MDDSKKKFESIDTKKYKAIIKEKNLKNYIYKSLKLKDWL